MGVAIIGGLLVLVAVVVGIYALVDVLGHTKDDFLLIGQDRTVWLVAIIGLTVACGFFGLIASGFYLISIKPKLQAQPDT